MERGWDRIHSFRSVSIPEAESFVRTADPAARVSAIQPLTAGLRNTNYRIDLVAGQPLVLRFYTADPSACAREAAILAAIAGRVPVPLIRHFAPTAEPPFSLFDWLEGSPLDQVLADAGPGDAREIARVCGSALAAIHALHFAAPGFLGPDVAVASPMPAWAPTMLSILAIAAPRLGEELAAGVRRVVESDAPAVEAVWSDAVLVHADFKPWNLLGRAPGAPLPFELTGVLDWEFSCAGCRLIDFGTFLRDESRRPEGFGDAFAGGYLAGGGSLPSDWRRLALLVDLVSVLQLANRHAGRGSDDLRRLLRESLDQLG
jgi:Ser/Thr protein kinase RdoA (MazF antagonist)